MLAIHPPGGRRLLLPESWDDAGPAAWPMLRALARLPAPQGKLEAIRLLLGLSRPDFRRLREDEVLTLSLGLPWLDGAPLTDTIRNTVRLGWRRYYLPQEAFADGKCLAFALADEYFTAAATGQGPAASLAALRLLATIARPRRGLYRRPPKSREEVEHAAPRFARLPPEWTLQALLYWAGVREGIDRRYGNYLFRGFALGDRLEPSINFGWWGQFRAVAESGTFGTLEEVYRTDFHEVCQFLVSKEDLERARARALEKTKTRNRA